MKVFDRKIWEEIGPKDKGSSKCPFCEEHLEKEFLIKEFKYWNILQNKFPVLGLLNHWLVVPKRHVILTEDLDANELLEFKEIEKFMKEKYYPNDYFSFVRQSRSSRSLEHLHYHYIPGSLYYEDLVKTLSKQGFSKK